jgi:hypothetical protein
MRLAAAVLRCCDAVIPRFCDGAFLVSSFLVIQHIQKTSAKHSQKYFASDCIKMHFVS